MRQMIHALLASVALGAAAQAQTVTDPAQFAQEAASGNQFEIESSEFLLSVVGQGEAAAFARQMIADHGAAGEQMKMAVEADGLAMPTALTPADQQQLDQLRQLPPAQVEQGYVAAQIAAHDKAVALFQGFAQAGAPSALKDFAGQTLPTLEQHQQHARTLPAQ